MGKNFNGDRLTRLAVCIVVAIAAVYAGETLCEGKNWPLWQKYGLWIKENKVQAIAILAAVLYGASLALWPEGEKPQIPENGVDGGFTACP